METNKATSLRRNESEYSPRTCSIGRPAGGTLCVPTFYFTCGVDELYLLLWQRSSNLFLFVFVAILLLLFIKPTTPVLRRLLNEGSALPSSTATTTAVRWEGPLLLVAGHIPHGRHLPSSCGRHCSASTLLFSDFGPSSWSLGTHHTDDTFQVRADDTALRSTLFVPAFGRISSPPAGHRPLRSGTARAPPIRLVCSALCQHVAQHISASCQHKPQDRPSTCTFFALRGSEAYMHDTPRTSILESSLRMAFDGDFAC